MGEKYEGWARWGEGWPNSIVPIHRIPGTWLHINIKKAIY